VTCTDTDKHTAGYANATQLEMTPQQADAHCGKIHITSYTGTQAAMTDRVSAIHMADALATVTQLAVWQWLVIDGEYQLRVANALQMDSGVMQQGRCAGQAMWAKSDSGQSR